MKVNTSLKFCHFTSKDNAASILSSRSFWFSRYDGMNDLAESELHKQENNSVFCLSFCNSNALNIPLYYLYAGIDGKGCRIDFSSSKINEIIGGKFKLFYVNSYGKVLKTEIPSKDYMLIADYIYYVADNGYTECNKMRTNEFGSSFADVYAKLKSKDLHYFVKSPIWKFEKEFRIVIKFNKPIKYPRIALEFCVNEKNERTIKVQCGPETTKEEVEQIREEFEDYNIKKVGSVLDCKRLIEMNLVKRNKHLIKQ